MAKLIIKYLLILIAIFPEIALAGVFDPPETDKSVEFLGMIFGGSVGGINLGTTSNPFIGELFEQINTIILVVATIILSYVGGVSILNTAQEGQIMGKKWSSIWIPLRSILGLLLLAPVPGSGFSLIQVTVMWIVLQGVGIADQIWNLTLDTLSRGVSVTQGADINQHEISQLENNGQLYAKKLLKSLVCVEVIRDKIKKLPFDHPSRAELMQHPIKMSFIDPKPSNLSNIDGDLFIGIANNDLDKQKLCGHIAINAAIDNNDHIATQDQAPLARRAYMTKKQALNAMASYLRPAARIIASTKPNDIASRFNADGMLYSSVAIYTKTMSRLLKPGSSIGGRTSAGEIIRKTSEQGRKFGWLSAGSFYFTFHNKTKSQMLSTATGGIAFKKTISDANSVDGSKVPGLTNVPQDIADKIQAIENVEDKIFDKPPEPGKELDYKPGIPQALQGNTLQARFIKPLANNLINLNRTMVKLVHNIVTKHHTGDPLLAHAKLGTQFMLIAETVWISVVIGSIIVSMLAVCSAQVGTGTAIISIFMTLVVVIVAILALLWVTGAALAIYVPLVPYMIFVVTAAGWMLLVVEAMVGAPIVALGLVLPANDELGKITPALNIIANIFLRPMLMVIGLLLGAKVYQAVIGLISFGFRFSFTSLQDQIGTSIFAWVALVILYAGFIIALVNKCFALIHILPDRILRWIGGSPEQTDVSAIEQTKQKFDSGTAKMGEGVKSATQTAAKKLQEGIEKKEKEQKDAAAKGSGMGG